VVIRLYLFCQSILEMYDLGFDVSFWQSEVVHRPIGTKRY